MRPAHLVVVALLLASAGCRRPSPRPPIPDVNASADHALAQALRLDARRMLAMDAGVACRAACPLEPARIVFKGDTVECACRKVVLP